MLKNIKGQFVLSLNDKPNVRALFQNSPLQPISIAYSCAPATHRRQFQELIITKK